MRRKIFVVICAALLLVCVMLLAACDKNGKIEADKRITVTLLDGEHYSVVGDNKRNVERGESVTFDVTLERGYKIIGAYGDKCEISDELSFNQTITFYDIKYKSTARLETVEMETLRFKTHNDEQIGDVILSSVLGQAEENLYYAEDILSVMAQPNDGYRFWCWSKGNFLNDGGEFYDYSDTLENFDFGGISDLYANFKNLADTGNSIFYRMDGGREIEQDVTQLLEHHPRANTYTAVDMRGFGIDCDGRYLAGWETENGEYIGLGSRVTVSSETATILLPIWKDYADEILFDMDGDGKLSLKRGAIELEELVIPREVRGIEVTTIGENAFAEYAASVYYIPDSVTTVENNAFRGCENLAELYMSDNVMNISDAAFSGCKNFTTLHLNAYMKPRRATDQAILKTDAYDRLALNAEKSDGTNLVVLGGSSVNYGYSVSAAESFCREQLGDDDITAYNLGFNATYAEMAQFEVLIEYLKPGDIFLHAPEQFHSAWYGNTMQSPLTSSTSVALTDGYYLFRFTEGNWQFLSSLTVNKYGNLFSMFSSFNSDRANSAEYSYSDYIDLTPVPELLPIGEVSKPECGEDKYFYSGNIDFNVYDSVEFAKNDIYSFAIAKGVNTFVAFPPMNRQKLMLMFDSEEQLKEAVDKYSARVKEILSDASLSVLLTQYDTVYDGRHFSDNDYHLGSPFKNTHTESVLAALVGVMKSEGKI
ncbi:MAG: leucine-rich repeat protein [Clostridiales bacterium]|nr:leucine-rich repeat protein [Clostridiales bacterium]